MNTPVQPKHLKNADGTDGCGADISSFCYGASFPITTPVKDKLGRLGLETKMTNVVMMPLLCPICQKPLLWETGKIVEIAQAVPS